MVSTESQAAMDAAKQAVIEFMEKNGRHNTTVHERVAPAIYHETITRTEHEDLVTVVDREVTLDHYHTSVQPITDSVTLEEQHHHNQLPIEDRTFQHDDPEDLRLRLAAERDKFRDEVQRVDGDRTQTVVDTLNAEHVHHHVYEIIQPVVNKHTIEPHVIHSTAFIREIHQNAAKHHTLSALPPVTMAEFLQQGGVLAGREERWDSFDGEPRSVGGTIGGAQSIGANAAPAEPAFSNIILPSTAANQPTVSGPERSLSLPLLDNSAAPPTTNTEGARPIPSAATENEAGELGEGPAAPQEPQDQTSLAAPPGPSNQHRQQTGRWTLLPMHLARSAGEGQSGHPSERAHHRMPHVRTNPWPGPAAGEREG